MIWPFGARKTFLAPEDEAWHVDTWAWLVEHLGGLEPVREAPLVLPTTAFFPSTGTQGHARATEVFRVVQALAGLEDWPCELAAQPKRPAARVDELLVVRSAGDPLPLGTFGPDGNTAVVTYDPDLLEDPAGLVATFAHELAHYLLSSIPTEPPGGHEMEEFATDLAVAYMGFGVFGAGTAMRFYGYRDAFSQGWEFKGQGYLRPDDWAFALAVFLSLRGETIAALESWLDDRFVEEVGKALRSIERRPDLLQPLRDAEARAIKIADR